MISYYILLFLGPSVIVYLDSTLGFFVESNHTRIKKNKYSLGCESHIFRKLNKCKLFCDINALYDKSLRRRILISVNDEDAFLSPPIHVDNTKFLLFLFLGKLTEIHLFFSGFATPLIYITYRKSHLS